MAANECKWCSFNHQTGINTFWVLSRDGIAMDPQHWSRVTGHDRPRNPSPRFAIGRLCTLALCWQQQSLWWFGSHPHTGSMCRDSIWAFMECVKYFKHFQDLVLKKKRQHKTWQDYFPVLDFVCECLASVTWQRRRKPRVSWATTQIKVFQSSACEQTWTNLFWPSKPSLVFV